MNVLDATPARAGAPLASALRTLRGSAGRVAAPGTIAGLVVRRVLGAIPTILGVITLAFVILRLAPGDPVTTLLGDYAGQPALVAELRHHYGFDQPLPVQYLRYVYEVATGDLGTSLRTSRPVWTEITDVVPYTFTLAIAALVVVVVIGLPLGIASGVWPNGVIDVVARIVALGGICVPNFAVALVLMLVFSLMLHLLPMLGVGDPHHPATVLSHLILPAIALGLRDSATLSRMTRAAVASALRQDYVVTARAKGVSETAIVLKHVLRNVSAGTINLVALEFSHILGSTVIIETIFGRPGVGTLLLQSISARDYPQLQGTLVFFAVCVIVVSLLADVLHRLADPRVGRGSE